MKIFKIPIFWQESAEVEVHANSLQEAIKRVEQHEQDNVEGLEEALLGGEYVEDSLEVNLDCAKVLNSQKRGLR